MKFILDIEPTYSGYKISCRETIYRKEDKSPKSFIYWVKIIQDKKEAMLFYDKLTKKLSNSDNFKCVESAAFFAGGQTYPNSASATFEDRNKIDLTRFMGN